VADSGAAVLIGAGDIARCGYDADERTAQLVDSILRADSIAEVEDAVFTVGDHAYPNGSERDFRDCFGSSWGDTAKRIMKRIRPAMGNHEHNTSAGAPYYRYFGERAGPAQKGYYSYQLGEWHIVVLNSEIAVNGMYAGTERRAQEDWLRGDLAENRTLCTLAYFHRPLFSSGGHGGNQLMAPLWLILEEAGVDVVIAGHEHHYERFFSQTSGAARDTLKGMTQFIVGTGGADLRGLRSPLASNSERAIQGRYGVLKLTLGAAGYQFAFLEVGGRVWDPGRARCRE
jgi:hypothetical protein